MSSGDKCRECGTAIPADSPGGFCAQCLLGLGLAKAGEGTVQSPESKCAVTGTPTEKSGDRIGRYRLLQEIGHGGCGVVYMAEQEEPVRRKVALKVIKLGMDTKQVVARFEAERQALALMDHPNIAKVLDAGATEMGRPYFVMELVGGTKITDYCDQDNLTTHQRLDLFMQVCRAIQHAHQKGIIHRDIKPSNVLVALQDGVAIPKVIDFGIAKATQGKLTDQTLFTAFEQFLGTPAYMSPEQAQLGGLDIDTRSDIYSLGVLLYELLTGQTPFDTKELVAAGLDEMRRTIREVEPVKPSTRLTQDLVAADVSPLKSHSSSEGRERADSHRLLQEVRGDLDWIVMKCLEKDRARRYETANGLASDIQRHLNCEPVMASPPSRWYEFQKTVRRHKFGFGAAAAVIMVLLLGVVASTWQAIRATRAEREQSRLRQQAQTAESNETRERQKAQTEATRSEQVAQFMKEMLKGVGPEVAHGRDTTLLRVILDQTAERVSRQLTNEPEVEADLRATLGNVYCDLADYTNAFAMHKRALDIRRQLYGDEHPEVASSLNDLGMVHQWEGRLEEAETMHREALAIRRRLPGPMHLDVAQSLSNLGWDLFFLAAHFPDRREAALAEAEPLLREALTIQRNGLGDDSVEVARTLNWLSLVLSDRNKSSEAVVIANEGLDICRRVYGNEHPALGNLSDALGIALEKQGKMVEAEAAYLQGMTARQRFLGGQHPELRFSFWHLGKLYWDQGRLPEAEDMFRQLMASPEKELVYGNGVNGAFLSVAQLLCAQGKFNEAKTVLRALQDRDERADVQTLNGAAWFLATSPFAEICSPPDALVYGEKAVAATGRTNASYLDTLAACYAAARQFTNAVCVQRKAIALLRDKKQIRDCTLRLQLYEVGQPYRDDSALAARATYLITQGKLLEAEAVLRECVTLRERQIPDEWHTFSTKSMLGGALLTQKKYNEAAALLLSGYEGMKEREARIPSASKVRLKEAIERLVQLYEATNQPDQAAEWKQKLEEFGQASAAKPANPPAAKPSP